MKEYVTRVGQWDETKPHLLRLSSHLMRWDHSVKKRSKPVYFSNFFKSLKMIYLVDSGENNLKSYCMGWEWGYWTISLPKPVRDACFKFRRFVSNWSDKLAMFIDFDIDAVIGIRLSDYRMIFFRVFIFALYFFSRSLLRSIEKFIYILYRKCKHSFTIFARPFCIKKILFIKNLPVSFLPKLIVIWETKMSYIFRQMAWNLL